MELKESAFQFFSRISTKPVRVAVPFWSLPGASDAFELSLLPGQVLELYGRSGSGKTEMLYQAALACAMPMYFHDIHFGGSGQAVIFIDLDYRFKVHRFRQLLERRVEDILVAQRQDPRPFLQSEAYKTLVKKVTQNVLVLRCRTAEEFSAALSSLTSSDAIPSLGLSVTVSTLIVDNIAAFADGFYEGSSPNHDAKEKKAGKNSSMSMWMYYDGISKLLRQVAKANRLAVLVSKPVSYNTQVEAVESQMMHKESLGRSWSQLVDYRLVLRKSKALLPLDESNSNNQVHPDQCFTARLIDERAAAKSYSRDALDQTYSFLITESGICKVG